MARSRYGDFNKIIKGPERNFQSPALSQKHVKNVCQCFYFTKFHFNST